MHNPQSNYSEGVKEAPYYKCFVQDGVLFAYLFAVVGIELKDLCGTGNRCSTELHLPPSSKIFMFMSFIVCLV